MRCHKVFPLVCGNGVYGKQNTVWREAMNISEYWPRLHQYQSLRDELFEVLGDADLVYRLPGNALSLGELCLELGETELAYATALETFKLEFRYGTTERALAHNIESLRSWFSALDRRLESATKALKETDLEREIMRDGFSLRPVENLMMYQYALLIFYGKASLYLRALGKAFPGHWAEWIG